MNKYIILPTYNEAENLEKIIKAIFDQNIADLNIIVVDDNSPDKTGHIADALSSDYPISVIHRKEKLGLGTAYIEGFSEAIKKGAEIVFEMDSDFSHDPADLPRLVKEIEKGFDFAIGSRRVPGGNVRGWDFRRNLQSKLAMAFARFALGLKTKDITAGFRCIRASILEEINFKTIKSNGYAFQEELIYRVEKAGYKISEVPVTFVDRKFGKSKLGVGDIVEFFITVLKLRFSR